MLQILLTVTELTLVTEKPGVLYTALSLHDVSVLSVTSEIARRIDAVEGSMTSVPQMATLVPTNVALFAWSLAQIFICQSDR